MHILFDHEVDELLVFLRNQHEEVVQVYVLFSHLGEALLNDIVVHLLLDLLDLDLRLGLDVLLLFIQNNLVDDEETLQNGGEPVDQGVQNVDAVPEVLVQPHQKLAHVDPQRVQLVPVDQRLETGPNVDFGFLLRRVILNELFYQLENLLDRDVLFQLALDLGNE